MAFVLVVGISVGILFLLTTFTIASYFCTRTRAPPQPPPAIRSNETQDFVVDMEVGVEEETIESYPKLLFSEAKLQRRLDEGCCSICLADYRSADMLRLLPDCGHMFHRRCIDPWLRLKPSCPVCRTSPLSSPLAEVVPLATIPG